MSNLDERIAIIGAGPSGLSTAWFLKKAGYRDVTVLEKNGRVGGLCKSITSDYDSYDLGANYVTWQYQETLKIAREVGAETYQEPIPTALIIPDGDGPTHYEAFFDAVRIDNQTGKKFSMWYAAYLGIKYLFKRWQLSNVIDQPTFAGVKDAPENLNVSFADWLARHGLEPLSRTFEAPITMMGYGDLDQIAAPYALKYMSLRTFGLMLLQGVPILGPWIPYPRRFIKGFQRMWEKVSWDLNVRCRVHVQRVEREPGKRIRIHLTQEDQVLYGDKPREMVEEFDKLIIASSVIPPDLQQFLDLTAEEQRLFDQVLINYYTMTTENITGLDMPPPATGAAVVPPVDLMTPWAVVQQWVYKGNPFTQFYVMVEMDVKPEASHAEPLSYREEIQKNIEKLIGRMGGTIQPAEEDWRTFNLWPYFQHVAPEGFSDFYSALEGLQGQNNTYYVGGATNFELIEPIVRYSKNLVETRF